MKPLRIGISANFLYADKQRRAYPPKTVLLGEESLYHWIEKAGAIPYMIPRLSGTLSLRDVALDLDGVVLSGGTDVCPASYGEEAMRPEWEGDYARDQYEIELFRMARALNKPILGVCRGHQLINVALGGTLYQDIATQNPDAQTHRDGDIYDELSHDMKLEAGSVLASIYEGQSEAHINSVHHQAIKDLGRGLKVQARSVSDNIIESVWLDEPDEFVFGVQWHPEWVTDPAMLDSSKIRDYFIDACIRNKAM